MSVGRICTRSVVMAEPEESVVVAAERMDREGVGTLVVKDGDRPVGILTDRDVVTRCVARGLDPATTDVAEVMTAPAETITEGTAIEDALSRMASTGHRRVVVVDGAERLVGILALDDVLDLLVEEAESIGQVLRAQVS